MITKELLRDLLDYDPSTGHLIRKTTGEVIDSNQSKGYYKCCINGKTLASHRVVWMWHHGTWPEKDIDHINGNRKDNRIENLRDVPHVVNMANINKTNKTGYEGVKTSGSKFASNIKRNGKKVYLGTFSTAEEAFDAYKEKHLEFYGVDSKFYRANCI